MDKILGIQRPSSVFRLPSSRSVSFNGRVSPLTVSDSFKTSRFPTLKCSALTSYPFDDFDKFQEASTNANLIPLYRCIFSDHLTPVLAYGRLVKEDDRYALSFLFESMRRTLDGSTMGLYSIIGAELSIEIVAKENIVTIFDHHQSRMTEEIVDDPMVVPSRIMDGWKPQLFDELIGVFCGDGKLAQVAGDISQIVLSRRFERRTFANPFDIYRALRIVDPSPYMNYLQARGCILVASSPEIRTQVKKNKITIRLLAGTVRRGKTPKEDLMLEKELLDDEKQRAKHIMLVDLVRNDVGKVSKFGSVKVEKLMNIERYSHVMHISSTITGEMLDDLNSWDVLRAALPVGLVSGVPKVKAMELIDQLEFTRRGPYGGGVGAISFSGDMDIGFAMATIVFPQNLD